jgi:hypothetical protein
MPTTSAEYLRARHQSSRNRVYWNHIWRKGVVLGIFLRLVKTKILKVSVTKFRNG